MAASLQDLGPDFWGEKTPPRVLIQRKRHHEGGREGVHSQRKGLPEQRPGGWNGKSHERAQEGSLWRALNIDGST